MKTPTIRVAGRNIPHPTVLKQTIRDLKVVLEHAPVQLIEFERELRQAEIDLKIAEVVFNATERSDEA